MHLWDWCIPSVLHWSQYREEHPRITEYCAYPSLFPSAYDLMVCYLRLRINLVQVRSLYMRLKEVVSVLLNSLTFVHMIVVAVAGSAVKWLRDQMKIISSAAEINSLAAQEPDTGGVYFVTAFSGLLAPYWDPGAAGLLIGSFSWINPNCIPVNFL